MTKWRKEIKLLPNFNINASRNLNVFIQDFESQTGKIQERFKVNGSPVLHATSTDEAKCFIFTNSINLEECCAKFSFWHIESSKKLLPSLFYESLVLNVFTGKLVNCLTILLIN